MDAGIVSALVTGGLALAGVIVTNIMSNTKIEHNLDKAQAVTDTKIEELTREVRIHNSFAEKIPVIENRLDTIEKRLEEMTNGNTKRTAPVGKNKSEDAAD